jgi:hypothetical protein
MTLIQTVTVGAGGAASIEFSSIPSTFTDLQLLISSRDTNAAVGYPLLLRFNGVTASYSDRILYGTGGAVASTSHTNVTFGIELAQHPGSTSTSNTFGNVVAYISNYAGSTNKVVSSDGVSENNAATAYPEIVAGLWGSTSAISSIQLFGNGNFVQNSTASLYGITRGSGGATVS